MDNAELDLLGRLSQTKLPDFKAQLQQWLGAESPALEGLSAEQIQSRQERTIFVVSFGLWDVWSLVTKAKDYTSAASSINRRVKVLIEQLDKLSERWGSTSLKVILMQTVDVTFLPGFSATGGEEYKTAVKIVTEWNKRLRQEAEQWARGTIYLFDTNAFMLDRIRDRQLYAAGIEEENGLGKNLDPGWENVGDACVEIGSGLEVMMSKEGSLCEDPEKYLFW